MPAKDQNHWLITLCGWNARGALWSDQVQFVYANQDKPNNRGDIISDVVEHYEERWDTYYLSWTITGNTLFGPCQRNVTHSRKSCPDCGRHMCSGSVRCNHCELDRQRTFNRKAAKNYRVRNGLIKTPLFVDCQQCGKRFQPKRSTARYCSSTCRVKAHRQQRKPAAT
jgi:hypothetical protein